MKTRQISFIIIYLLFHCYSVAQKVSLDEVENVDASTYKPFTVELETKKKYSASTNFQYVLIKDGRADKSKIGITRAGEKVVDRRFILPKDFTSYVEEKVNKLCDPNANGNDTVVFVVNNLWLYQTISPGSDLKQAALGVSNNWNSNCFLNIDCYKLNKDRYTWFCNVDTVVTTRGWLPLQCNRLLTETFASAISYSDSIFFNKNFGAEFTPDEIESSLVKRYNHPILTADSYSKGIFTSYDDFLQNKARAVDIEVYYQKNKRQIRSTTIPDSLIKKSWGFSDGTNVFVNIEGAFYKLIRSENTFDLIGPRIIEHKTTVFNKTVSAAVSYWLISPLAAPFAFFEPEIRRVELFKLYQLNITDGILR